MDTNNVVLLRGTLSSEPVIRSLPSGGTVTRLEVTTRVDGRSTSVPVVVHDRPVWVTQGDPVVVVGHVSRRFFRAGGVTRSHTEVIAAEVVKATRAPSVARVVAGAVGVMRPE
jgi:single-stranded DNA-binding protein